MFAGAAFTDSADIKATEAVDMLTALGVIDGFEDGSFQPNGTVTRAQMAKMIYVARTGNSNADSYASTPTTFTDITGHWAAGYIKYCQANGIIAGKSATKFCPNDNVTGIEAAKMLLVTAGYKADKEGLVGAAWANKTLGLAEENSLLDDVNTSLAAALPRQYAAQIIYNALDMDTVKYEDGEVVKNETTKTEMKQVPNYAADGKTILSYSTVATTVTENETVGEKYLKLVTDEDLILDSMSYDDNKDQYSFLGYTKIKGDYSSLMGQKVKVLHEKNKTDKVFGVYADPDSKVVATAICDDLDTVSSSNEKIKVDGTEYKTDGALSSVQVFNFNQSAVAGKLASYIDNADVAPYSIKLIDNDGNGKVDAAVYTPAKVGKVNTVSKSAIAVTQGVGTVKFDDYTIYDGVKKNDYVSVVADTYTSDDNGVVTKLDVVSGKIDGARTHEVKINGTWYKVASTAPNMATGDSYDVAIVGGVVVFGEMTAESSKNVMAITGVKTKAGATPNSTVYNLENEVGDNDKYLKVKAYFADGTSSEIKISKINGTKLNNLTVAAGSTLEATVAQTIAVANLYTYSKLSDGMYDVKLLSSTNKAGYDVVGNGNYSKQKIDSKTLADDAVVFVIATNETKVMTGKQIKDWPDSANFSGMYAATESNGINYIKVAAIKGNTTTPNADGDLKYAYVVANSYTSKVEGEDGNKTAYDVWTADGAKTLYVDGTGTTVASGSILVYKEDGKYITITDSFKPSNGSYAQANATAKIRIDTVAITGFDYKSEGTLAIAKDASSTIPTDLTLDKDCVFIAVNSKEEEGMEGGMEGVQFANPGKVDSSKYIPNAIVVTDSDDDNNVLAVIYDANDIDWNDGLKDASNNPAEF